MKILSCLQTSNDQLDREIKSNSLALIIYEKKGVHETNLISRKVTPGIGIRLTTRPDLIWSA